MRDEELWRRLAQDPNLDRSLRGTCELLASDVPLQGLLVCVFDFEARRLRLVAADWLDDRPHPALSARPWTDENLAALRCWQRSGDVVRLRGGEHELHGILIDGAEDLLLGPLHAEGIEAGLLLLVARSGARFVVRDEALAERLLAPLSAALATDRRIHELVRLRETLEADKRALLTRLDRQEIVEVVVGADVGLAPVMERVQQVAHTDAPVLIFGETGAGKEVVARLIHSRSRRRAGPMLRVNCGAIPPGLVDSELFGHERGSFTGAVASRPGWFERADSGTLFLDEIGELPQEAQVRLLRVLQEGTLERVGATRPIAVDVRVVAATHRDLEAMAREGTFREDLWYRLSVFPIYLPPLRERRPDIPELAAHFSARAGRRLGGAPLVPSKEDLDLLSGYDWPGNVRELAAVIERAAILGDGKRLDIPGALGARGRREPLPAPTPADSSRFLTLDEAMRRHIEEALVRAQGQIEGAAGAARLLDINPHTLRARMRKLGIDWSRYRGPRQLGAGLARLGAALRSCP